MDRLPGEVGRTRVERTALDANVAAELSVENDPGNGGTEHNQEHALRRPAHALAIGATEYEQARADRQCCSRAHHPPWQRKNPTHRLKPRKQLPEGFGHGGLSIAQPTRAQL